MKKILLVTYYFPPCGGAAVMRWHRLIKGLVQQGVEITVICPEEADYPYYDSSLVLELPQSLRIIRTGKSKLYKIWSLISKRPLPYGSLETSRSDSLARKILIWLRLNLIVPDIRIFWLPAALRAAKKELRSRSYDTLITTGPPHSTHLLGLLAKRSKQTKWMTDFRDPWSKIHYLEISKPSRLTLALHKYLEKKVLATADLALVVSKYIAESLAPGRKVVLYNGYAADDFAGLEYKSGVTFRASYIGQFTAGQNPELILEILHETGHEIELRLIGTRLDGELRKSFVSKGNIRIEIQSFCDHRDALAKTVNSELLILLINDYKGSEGMLTTKLFEYLASGRPILCIGNPNSEAAKLIIKHKAGFCCDYNQITEASSYVAKIHAAWASGEETSTNTDSREYELKSQVELFLKALNSL